MRLLELSQAFARHDLPHFDLSGFRGGGKHFGVAADGSAQDSVVVHHELYSSGILSKGLGL